MFAYDNELQELAERARLGDDDALYEFRSRLEALLTQVVRRTLRTGRATTPLARQVLALARQAACYLSSPGGADPEALVHRVTRALCDSAEQSLQLGRRAGHYQRETVRC